MTKEATQFVRERIERITQFEENNREAIANGRRLGWHLLGMIFEVSNEIEANAEAKARLESEVEALPEMEKRRWVASSKSVFDNVLVLALGYEKTKSKRHYYGRGFNAAKKAGKTSAAEFVELVQSKDGLSGLIGKVSTKSSRLTPSEVISGFLRGVPASDTPDLLELPVEPDEEGQGLVLLLLHKESDASSRVLTTVAQPEIIASVIKSLKAEPSKAELDRIIRGAQWDLNRLVEMRTPVWRGTIEDKDRALFEEAVKGLSAQPALFDRFFDGKPEFRFDKEGELMVQNDEAHILDPARYIKNAKPFALVPFSLSEDTPATKEALDKVGGYKLWRSSPPRRRRAKAADRK